MKCRITCHGKTMDVEISAEQSLLEAALLAGLEPPYSCLEGVCGTCIATLEEGDVILAPGHEIENQSVRTCMTRPRSNLAINYDKK
jgi:ferredoxin